jgi:hypothetical protein
MERDLKSIAKKNRILFQELEQKINFTVFLLMALKVLSSREYKENK